MTNYKIISELRPEWHDEMSVPYNDPFHPFLSPEVRIQRKLDLWEKNYPERFEEKLVSCEE